MAIWTNIQGCCSFYNFYLDTEYSVVEDSIVKVLGKPWDISFENSKDIEINARMPFGSEGSLQYKILGESGHILFYGDLRHYDMDSPLLQRKMWAYFANFFTRMPQKSIYIHNLLVQVVCCEKTRIIRSYDTKDCESIGHDTLEIINAST